MPLQHVRVPGRATAAAARRCSPKYADGRRRRCRCRPARSPPTATGWIERVDRRGAAVTAPAVATAAPPRLAPRAASRALAVGARRVPRVFFAWPVAAIIGRGLAPGGGADRRRARRPRRSGTSPGSRSGRRRSRPSLTLPSALPGAYVLARFEFRGPAAVLAARHGAVRAADRRRRRRLPGPARPASARARLGVGADPRSPTSSSTTPSWCAPSAALWAHLDPRLEEAARVLGASPLARLPRGDAARCSARRSAAAASIVFLFTFTSFGVVLILGGPRHATLEVEIYRQTAQLLDLAAAAALAVAAARRRRRAAARLVDAAAGAPGARPAAGAGGRRPRAGRAPPASGRSLAADLALHGRAARRCRSPCSSSARSSTPTATGSTATGALGRAAAGTSRARARRSTPIGNSLRYAVAATALAVVARRCWPRPAIAYGRGRWRGGCSTPA